MDSYPAGRQMSSESVASMTAAGQGLGEAGARPSHACGHRPALIPNPCGAVPGDEDWHRELGVVWV